MVTSRQTKQPAFERNLTEKVRWLTLTTAESRSRCSQYGAVRVASVVGKVGKVGIANAVSVAVYSLSTQHGDGDKDDDKGGDDDNVDGEDDNLRLTDLNDWLRSTHQSLRRDVIIITTMTFHCRHHHHHHHHYHHSRWRERTENGELQWSGIIFKAIVPRKITLE